MVPTRSHLLSAQRRLVHFTTKFMPKAICLLSSEEYFSCLQPRYVKEKGIQP